MILLDTDHVTVLQYTEDPRCVDLKARLNASSDERHATTVITVEEQTRGWLAEINRHREFSKQVRPYGRLLRLMEFFAEWEVIAFDERAAREADRLRKQRVRIGTQDLKIASIARVHDALLLSANLQHFEKVPGLNVENWLVQ
jgi:tRNA(fMet)-specific endonuclease VapC